jgi:hypothetical protein
MWYEFLALGNAGYQEWIEFGNSCVTHSMMEQALQMFNTVLNCVEKPSHRLQQREYLSLIRNIHFKRAECLAAVGRMSTTLSDCVEISFQRQRRRCYGC